MITRKLITRLLLLLMVFLLTVSHSSAQVPDVFSTHTSPSTSGTGSTATPKDPKGTELPGRLLRRGWDWVEIPHSPQPETHSRRFKGNIVTPKGGIDTSQFTPHPPGNGGYPYGGPNRDDFVADQNPLPSQAPEAAERMRAVLQSGIDKGEFKPEDHAVIAQNVQLVGNCGNYFGLAQSAIFAAIRDFKSWREQEDAIKTERQRQSLLTSRNDAWSQAVKKSDEQFLLNRQADSNLQLQTAQGEMANANKYLQIAMACVKQRSPQSSSTKKAEHNLAPPVLQNDKPIDLLPAKPNTTDPCPLSTNVPFRTSVGLPLVQQLTGGTETTPSYVKVFFDTYPEYREVSGFVIVHHAVLRVFARQCGQMFSWSELHSAPNLRGICKPEEWLHKEITADWTRWIFARGGYSHVFRRAEVLEHAREIDQRYGKLFYPRLP